MKIPLGKVDYFSLSSYYMNVRKQRNMKLMHNLEKDETELLYELNNPTPDDSFLFFE